MPRTARLSGSAATPRQSRGPTTLPTYEPATHALNRDAQNALHDLPRNHKLESLRNRLQIANEHLTSAAADVNDRLHAKTVRHEKIKKRQEAASSQGSNAQDDEDPKEMRMATEDMTDKLDQRIQDMIDAIGHVANVERVLKELDMNATNNRGVIAPTQSTIGASQFRGPKRRRLDGDDADDEEDSQVPVDSEGLYTILQRKESDHEAEYQALSLAERYATHNDYVGFKKMVHDARHPGDNAPPLPHHSTWFPSEGNTTLDTSFGGADMTQIDEDEDFQVAAERISVKCPITLLTMKDPVQSTKCPHNFEKSAILQMINLSEPEDGRRGGVKSMKCPQCETLLTANDLQPNPVLLRKIKRLEEAERAQDEESENSDGDHNDSRLSNRQEITSSPAPTARSYKREHLSRPPSSRPRRDASMVPSTQILNLEDSASD